MKAARLSRSSQDVAERRRHKAADAGDAGALIRPERMRDEARGRERDEALARQAADAGAPFARQEAQAHRPVVPHSGLAASEPSISAREDGHLRLNRLD